ncbi:cold shock domain-containing protein [Winogradskyella poriferorum]|uniref:cold shock domain-containing protein n=1 Tax=Winogradskyella poriferorum TaxID=307627 RepID=UPI003D64E01D
MVLGYTKWFDNEKGFGIIESLDNIEYFLHKSNIDRKPEKVLLGTPFLFDAAVSKGKEAAINAIVPKTKEDFALGINLLLSQDSRITYVATIKGESRWGNPYIRRETKTMDTTSIFVKRLCRDKGLEEIFDLFKAGFDINHDVNWNFEEVSKYYKITERQISGLDSVLTDEELNTRMKEDMKRNDGEFVFRHSHFFINQAKKELIERLTSYYDSKLSDKDLFDSWQLNLKESHFYVKKKSSIDIDEKVLLKYKDRLEEESIKKIIQYYNVSDDTFNLLVSPFFNKEIIDISSFESSLKIYNSLDKDLQPVYFDLIIGAITNDFYFDIWKNKKYNIDRDNKIISPSWGRNDDFNLKRGIYIENIDKIGITEIERINKLNSDDVELIKILLESAIKSEEFSSYKAEKLIVLLKNFENSFSTQILDDFFRINNSENLKILNDISIQKLINLYEFYVRDFIYETILEKIDFNISYELNLLLEVFDYSEDFTTFIKSKMSLSTTSFESFKTCLTYLEENNESLDVKIMAKVFEKELEIADIIEIQELSLKLELKDYEIIQRLISDYLNNKEVLYENEYIILLSINSQSFLESILSKSFEIKPQKYAHRSRDYKEGSAKTYLETLFDNNQAIKINKTIFLDFVRDKLKSNEKLIFNFLIKNRIDLYSDLIEEVELNEKVIVDFIELFEENKDRLRPFTTVETDLNLIFKIVDDVSNDFHIKQLNSFFQKNKFSYQSLFLKYFISVYQSKQISKERYLVIQNLLELKELSALMIKEFIVSEVSSRNELMDLMNNILKAHFLLLDKFSDNHEVFYNLFSLRNLVNECNGRKSYRGLEFWQGGGQNRWYTNGNHGIVVGAKEQIYCEGRFWKSERFYNSSTNRQLPESNSFYWCRNKVCVKVNDSLNLDNPYLEWTLNEVNQIFNLKLDRLAFIHLAGWLNRMETIFNRLTCSGCTKYLRPKAYTPTLLGHYAVPIFWCVNEACSEHHLPIRFTHCRGCKKILDSRECDTCQNCNWLICDDEGCGKCGCGATYTPVYAQYD